MIRSRSFPRPPKVWPGFALTRLERRYPDNLPPCYAMHIDRPSHMKLRSTVVALVVTLATFIAIPAHAALVGRIHVDSFIDLLGLGDADVDLADLQPSGPTDLGTTVNVVELIARQGSSFYFTNSKGLFVQPKGDSERTALRASQTLSASTRMGPTLVVSNSNTSGNGSGSFVYGLTAKKLTRFTPRVGTIISASLTRSGKTVAMIARGTDKKEHVYLSDGKVTALKTLPLPDEATSCTTISISPQGKTLQVGCQFKTKGSSTTKAGAVTIALENKAYGKQRRWVTNVELVNSVWLSEQRLATIEAGVTTNDITLNVLTVSKSRITAKRVVAQDATTTRDGVEVFTSPFMIARHNDNQFFYSSLFLGTNLDEADPLFGTTTSLYDLTLGTNSTLIDDGRFWYLTEAF